MILPTFKSQTAWTRSRWKSSKWKNNWNWIASKLRHTVSKLTDTSSLLIACFIPILLTNSNSPITSASPRSPWIWERYWSSGSLKWLLSSIFPLKPFKFVFRLLTIFWCSELPPSTAKTSNFWGSQLYLLLQNTTKSTRCKLKSMFTYVTVFTALNNCSKCRAWYYWLPIFVCNTQLFNSLHTRLLKIKTKRNSSWITSISSPIFLWCLLAYRINIKRLTWLSLLSTCRLSSLTYRTLNQKIW